MYDHFARTSDWPKVSVLRRERFKAGDDMDLRAAAQSLPQSLGECDVYGDRVSLKLRGLSLCPSAQPLVEAAIGVIQAAVEQYGNSEEVVPTVHSADLVERLNVEPTIVQQVGLLMRAEPILYTGVRVNGDTETWSWEIPEDIIEFASVQTIDDYLSVQATKIKANAAFAGTPSLTLSPWAAEIGAAIQAQTPPALRVDDLDSLVSEACRSLFESGHYQQGVIAAVLALRNLVREKSGARDLDGDALMGNVLSGNPPLIGVGDQATETGQNIQRGVRSLAQGIMAAIRNPLAHDTVDLKPHEAMEMVAIISLVARWIQEGPPIGGAASSTGAVGTTPASNTP